MDKLRKATDVKPKGKQRVFQALPTREDALYANSLRSASQAVDMYLETEGDIPAGMVSVSVKNVREEFRGEPDLARVLERQFSRGQVL